jgi:hypothetical protein
MCREAITRLVSARRQGRTIAEVADLFESLKEQIEDTAEDWRADRARCADGSIAFVGRPHSLVIHPDGIYVGPLGGPDDFLPTVGITRDEQGWVFPAPNLKARMNEYR